MATAGSNSPQGLINAARFHQQVAAYAGQYNDSQLGTDLRSGRQPIQGRCRPKRHSYRDRFIQLDNR